MIEITKHAEERYVERIMGYTERSDIVSYIVENKDLITERINKMVEFGTDIYEGRIRDGSYVHVVLKDLWALILDRKKAKVITLYKISLITDDDEFNQVFVNKMERKILDLQSKRESETKQFDFIFDRNKKKIDENTVRKKEYEQAISSLITENECLTNETNAAKEKLKCTEMDLKHAVEDLVASKIF